MYIKSDEIDLHALKNFLLDKWSTDMKHHLNIGTFFGEQNKQQYDLVSLDMAHFVLCIHLKCVIESSELWNGTEIWRKEEEEGAFVHSIMFYRYHANAYDQIGRLYQIDYQVHKQDIENSLLTWAVFICLSIWFFHISRTRFFISFSIHNIRNSAHPSHVKRQFARLHFFTTH